MAAQHSKPSWRDRPKPRQNQARTSVRTRRFLTTSFVTVCLAALAGLIYYLASRPTEATRIIWLRSSEKISSTLPPLAFNTETRESLSKLRSGARFMSFEAGVSGNKFTDQLRSVVSKAEPRDVLLAVVRQHGISIDGVPYLATNSYLLPDDLKSKENVIPFTDVLSEVSKHAGQSLILLDWGSVLYDARLGIGRNQFLQDVSDLLSDNKASSRVWVLASHGDGEISQDQTAVGGSGYTRFLGACVDGLVGDRKPLQPGTAMDLVGNRRYLNLADFTNYVVRRVVETSNGEQRPVLMRGGKGLVQIANDDQSFVQALNVALARINNDGLPIGMTKKKDDDASKPKADTPKESSTAAVASESPQPAEELWSLIEQWNKPDPDLQGWSMMQIAPAAAKEIAAHAVRLEARGLAGQEYKNDNIYGKDNAATVAIIISEAKAAQKKVAVEFTSNAKTSRVFDRSVGTAEEQHWLAALESLKAYRTLASRLYDASTLCSVLDTLEIDSGLPEFIKRSATQIAQWNAAWVSYSADPTAKNYESWSSHTSELTQLKGELDKTIDDLSKKAAEPIAQRWRLSDALLRTSLPTLQQRKALRLAMQKNAANERADLSIKNVTLSKETAENGSELNLLFDNSLLKSLGKEFNAGDPGLVIEVNKAIRSMLKESLALPETAWLFIDGRDLVNGQWHFSSEESSYFSSQFPTLPDRPTLKPTWALSVMEGASPIEKLRFTDDKSKQIKLVLRSSGNPSPVKEVSVQFAGIQGKISDSPQHKSYPPTSKTIAISQQEWNDRVVISGSEHAFMFDIQPMANLTGNETLAASFTVTFEDASLPAQTTRMAVFVLDKRPIELIVQEQRGIDGELRWETSDNINDMVTLRPFPNHASPFRLSLRNKADIDLGASVELYSLQQRDAGQSRPLGRLKNDQGSLFAGLMELKMSSMKLVGKSEELKLAPGAIATVSLSSGSPAATAPAAPAPTAGTTPPSASGTDASFGLVAVVRQSNSSNSFRTWLEYVPLDASEFLDVDAHATEQKQIEMSVSLRDDASNGKPDLVPVGFSAGEKIALDWITWPWQQDSLSVNSKREIDLENTSVSFLAQSPSNLPTRIPLTISVDNNPRALIYLLDSRGLRRADPYEQSESYVVEKVKLKTPEMIYDRDIYHIDAKAKPMNLNEMDAIFPGRIDEPVSVLLNVDHRSQSTSLDSYPARFSFGPEPGDKKSFFGDRRNQFNIELNEDGSADLNCTVSDWSFDFDFRGATDIEAPLVFKDENGANHELATVVLDGTKPEIAPKNELPKNPVVVGGSIPFTFTVSDRSPIKEVSIQATPVGAEPKPIKAPTPRSFNVKKKRYINEYTLNLKDVELPLGKPLSISIKAIDHVGNEANYTYKQTLRIIEKPPANPGTNGEPTPPHKGNLKGVVKLSTGKVFDNKNLGDNKATIKELNKEVLLDGGSFQFEDIESGKYTIEAKVKYQGIDHVGEKAIELKKPEDWNKPIEISLKPKEDDKK